MGKKKPGKVVGKESIVPSTEHLSQSKMALASPQTTLITDVVNQLSELQQNVVENVPQDMLLDVGIPESSVDETERNLRIAARQQANFVQLQTRLTAGAMRQIVSTGRMDSLEQPLILFEESSDTFCLNLKEEVEPAQRGIFTPGLYFVLQNLQPYYGMRDRIFSNLKVGESISRFQNAITNAKKERSIRLSFENFKIYSDEAEEVYRSILTESTNIHFLLNQQLSSGSRQGVHNSAQGGKAAMNNRSGERDELQSISEKLSASFFNLNMNIDKYRSLVEEDLPRLVCIEREIEVFIRGRRLAFWFSLLVALAIAIIGPLVFYIENNLSTSSTIIIVITSLLVILGFFAYGYHWIDKKQTEFENLFIMAKSKVDNAEKFLQTKTQSLARLGQQPAVGSIQLQTSMVMPQLTVSPENQQNQQVAYLRTQRGRK